MVNVPDMLLPLRVDFSVRTYTESYHASTASHGRSKQGLHDQSLP